MLLNYQQVKILGIIGWNKIMIKKTLDIQYTISDL
jgi:hypothetical protein